MNVLGIDPGMSGGMALLGDEGLIEVWKMPATESDVGQLIQEIAFSASPAITLIEKVHSMPEQGNVSAFTFGRGVGLIIGCLISNHMRHEEIDPQKWQKILDIPPRAKKPKKPKEGVVYPPEESHTEFKNRLKSKAQTLFPGVKVILANADALLIAEAARRQYGRTTAGSQEVRSAESGSRVSHAG